MAICIALLRGINVSGKNMIKMTELKRMFETMGFGRVQTYINSGNVLFESDETEETLRKQVEQAIETTFGFSIHVVLRTVEELERAIVDSPYAEEVAPDGKNVNVGLMNEAPSQEGIDRLGAYKGVDDFQVVGRDLHVIFRQFVADSKLANSLQKLGTPVTVRNWNTMNKLVALANEMKA